MQHNKRGARVMIVEDDEDVYELYSEFLADEGYEVVGAHNGHQAVDAAIRELPDVILMDLALPGRNGVEAARLLKANVRTRDTPIVALSGLVQEYVVNLAYEVGCELFLSKPCPLPRVLETVETLLSVRRASEDGRRILIVEDDEDIQSSLLGVLRGEGYAVETARNGREALEHLKKVSVLPRLILLDLMMPEMDGWTFRAAQREDAALAGIPVVLLSAAQRVEEEAIGLGVADCIPKPMDLMRLLASVERHAA